MTIKQRLLVWANQKKTFKTSDVIRWGIEHYSNVADRTARKLRADGLFRRLDFNEALYYHTKEDIYAITEKGIKEAKKFGQKTLF